MPRLIHPLSVVALLIAGGAGLIYFDADRAPRRVLDGDAPSSVQRHFDDGSPAGKEMERRRQILMHRCAVRERAVGGLLNGRLTLMQAASRFRDAAKEHPITWPPSAESGHADGERLCRIVMEQANFWVETNLPSQATAVAALLEAELERHRDPDGTVRVPD